MGAVRVSPCKQWSACVRVGEQSPMGYFFLLGGGINSCQLWLPCLRVGEQTPMGYIFSWGGGVNSCKLWFRVIEQTVMGYFFNEWGVISFKMWLECLRDEKKLQ